MKLLPIAVTIPKNTKHAPCDVCSKAKQQQLTFPLSFISSCAPFELVHIDTWGALSH